MKPLEKFSLPWEIFQIVTGDKKLATYHELQTVYDTQDLYDLLECQDVHIYLEEVAHKRRAQEEAARAQQNNKR